LNIGYTINHLFPQNLQRQQEQSNTTNIIFYYYYSNYITKIINYTECMDKMASRYNKSNLRNILLS